ncbi:MAG: hypothetical protein BMS9Abin09_0983 [Gammaproteobacteria bacterium]|nr:MAG: hypothetical protein BMS9Abin09_0983 [Gammaproteobacteria bacterium]
MTHRELQNGFTLVEMSIVLVIISLLVGGLLTPLSTQKELEWRTDNAALMEQAREALIGFALVNGRLPCPDTNLATPGVEDACAPGSTTYREGDLPWVTLGLDTGLDPWGNAIRYAVNGAFSNPGLTATTPFPLNTTGAPPNGVLRVSATQPANCTVPGTVAENVPAILWSGSKNDYASNDENENTNGDRCFVSKDYNTIAGTEFDDQVLWLSPNVLFNRMVSAGVLP